MTEPRHNAERAKGLIDSLRRQGYAVDDLLRDIGLREDIFDQTETILPFDQFAAIWESAAEMADDDCLGLRYGIEGRAAVGSPMGYYSKTAPTLRSFVMALSQYQRVFSDAYEFDTSNLDSDGIVSWYANVSPGIRMNQVSESATAALVRGMRTLTGRAIRPISVSFHHLRSTNLDVFERFFGCPVKFGEPRSALNLKQADLDLPLITQDERLHSILRDVCNRILAERETRPASITRRVEQYISEHIENGWPSQDSVARNLGMSSRTLARRLAEEGTSFRSVSNVLREDLATSYVRESPLPLTEVAFVLGYNDVSAFSTAFHRWTGQSPSHFRHAAGRS